MSLQDASDGLLSGGKWTHSVTYGDPHSGTDYGAGYDSDLDGDGVSAPFEGFRRISSTMLAAARSVLDSNGSGTPAAHAGFSVEGFTNLGASYDGSSPRNADIRYASTGDATTAYTHSVTSGSAIVGADVWLGGSGQSPVAGNYDYLTFLHETGHALGLKHPHDPGPNGTVPTSYDSLEFSVMSYRSYVGASIANGYHMEKWGSPQSYMMLDIAALQQLYGADYSTNSGDTTYSWGPTSGNTLVNGAVAIAPGANRIFATIWDGGGHDTYDLSAYSTGVTVDLNPGAASTFSTGQLANLGGGSNNGHARGNIFNALEYQGSSKSLIENAIGSSSNDRLTGNTADNLLKGNGGDDTLQGGGGADTLNGGTGHDVFRFTYASQSSPTHLDRLVGGGGAAAFSYAGSKAGDLIDLHSIDADTTVANNQAFIFGHGEGHGHLWLENVGDVTEVFGNTDSDATPEFKLAIYDNGVHAGDYSSSDFLL